MSPWAICCVFGFQVCSFIAFNEAVPWNPDKEYVYFRFLRSYKIFSNFNLNFLAISKCLQWDIDVSEFPHLRSVCVHVVEWWTRGVTSVLRWTRVCVRKINFLFFFFKMKSTPRSRVRRIRFSKTSQTDATRALNAHIGVEQKRQWPVRTYDECYGNRDLPG